MGGLRRADEQSTCIWSREALRSSCVSGQGQMSRIEQRALAVGAHTASMELLELVVCRLLRIDRKLAVLSHATSVQVSLQPSSSMEEYALKLLQRGHCLHQEPPGVWCKAARKMVCKMCTEHARGDVASGPMECCDLRAWGPGCRKCSWVILLFFAKNTHNGLEKKKKGSRIGSTKGHTSLNRRVIARGP